MSDYQPVAEQTECRNCGRQFDLAAQPYYADLCPNCVRETQNPSALERPCAICGQLVDHRRLRGATMHTISGTERVSVCSKGCKHHAKRSAQDPRPPAMEQGEDPFAIREDDA